MKYMRYRSLIYHPSITYMYYKILTFLFKYPMKKRLFVAMARVSADYWFYSVLLADTRALSSVCVNSPGTIRLQTKPNEMN